MAQDLKCTDVWLRPNRRALCMASVIPMFVAASCTWGWLNSDGVAGWMCLGVGTAALVLALVLGAQALRPRLAVRNGQLLLFLRFGAPLTVPLSIVECVLLGRPETQLELGSTSRMVCLVIRLAEAAHDYRQRAVKPALGRWADGYITIHGAWCEPLTLELAQGLNSKLRQAQQKLQSASSP